MPSSDMAAVEHPPCPTCHEPMSLLRSTPNSFGFEVQTFECETCGQAKIVEVMDPLDEAKGWLTARGLQPPE
jgi:hypothetical protein